MRHVGPREARFGRIAVQGWLRAETVVLAGDTTPVVGALTQSLRSGARSERWMVWSSSGSRRRTVPGAPRPGLARMRSRRPRPSSPKASEIAARVAQALAARAYRELATRSCASCPEGARLVAPTRPNDACSGDGHLSVPRTSSLPLGHDDATPYRLLTKDHVSTFEADGRTFLKVAPEALTLLTRGRCRTSRTSFGQVTWHRPSILDDAEASPNDRFVAMELLRNACIAAEGVLPSCQDTGTAIVMGKKGQYVMTGGGDEEAIARGVFDTYQTANLRYSLCRRSTRTRRSTPGTTSRQIELYATDGDAYSPLYDETAAPPTRAYLYQETGRS
ncbi:MAG: fumarate hydratase [Polyangiaceae bacterium]